MIHISGSLSDTSIFSASAFELALERNELNLPIISKMLPNSTILAYHYFVGNEISLAIKSIANMQDHM